MLCFDVYINGRRLCRAGLAAGGLSIIIHWSNWRSRSKRGSTDLDVGGLVPQRRMSTSFRSGYRNG